MAKLEQRKYINLEDNIRTLRNHYHSGEIIHEMRASFSEKLEDVNGVPACAVNNIRFGKNHGARDNAVFTAQRTCIKGLVFHYVVFQYE